MADQEQDRQLPATERKIRKAREEGQVARSRELGHLTVLGVGGVALAALAPFVSAWSARILEQGLRFDARTLADPQSMSATLSALVVQALWLVVPLGTGVAFAALAASVLAGGWNFTWKAMAPQFQRLDPIAGIGRLFSGQQLVEALKAVALASVLFAIGGFYLQSSLPRFAGLLGLPLPAALASAADVLLGGLALLGFALLLFALIDVPLQRQMLLRRLRMSHEEVKKEFKDIEGNLEIKAKIRARMRALANRRMLAAVPGADIVVMNPTHYAVALKYDEARMAAPRVVAKGADLLALRIRDIAREAGVPVLQAAPLARALYAHAEVDREIPAALFSAVAQVLAWVFQLRQASGRGATPPAPVPEVPPELDPAQTQTPASAPGRREPEL